jgi:hypothetical protein
MESYFRNFLSFVFLSIIFLSLSLGPTLLLVFLPLTVPLLSSLSFSFLFRTCISHFPLIPPPLSSLSYPPSPTLSSPKRAPQLQLTNLYILQRLTYFHVMHPFIYSVLYIHSFGTFPDHSPAINSMITPLSLSLTLSLSHTHTHTNTHSTSLSLHVFLCHPL